MYETGLNNQLPVLWGDDLLLNQARQMVTFANAHDFDEIYEQDRPILWNETEAPDKSPYTRTIYNNQETRQGHRTNVEVEDFIRYLETKIAVTGVAIDARHITGATVVSLIKQILGLEPKAQDTTSGFEPYLGSKMYYAGSEGTPTGDEMLGRTWAFMKHLAKRERYSTEEEWQENVDDYKKSVVLALLESAEISNTSVDTHCQTRISGELFKILAWHLPESNLRPLIAGADLPPAQTKAEIEARIESAPLRAEQLFQRMKREDSGEIRRLIERCLGRNGEEPKLWERYEAYYDDLYRRTKVVEGTKYHHASHIHLPDGRMYMKDEHILERDGHGNLVSKYNADGSLRDQPVIIYYQAEFQVFEHTFTKLMKREFEDQRGLKY